MNVISVGNYLNEFLLNNMHSCLNQLLQLQGSNILGNCTIHVYFHNFGCSSENLEPIAVPNFIINTDTIQAIVDTSIKTPATNGNVTKIWLKMKQLRQL